MEKFLQEEFKEDVLMLDSCAYDRRRLLDLRDQIEITMEQEGHADVYDFFPVAFSESDVKRVLEEELKLEDLILDEDVLISKAKLNSCCKKLENNLTEYLEDNLESVLSEGSSKAGSKAKDKKNAKKNSSESFPLKDDQILEALEKSKLLGYIVEDDRRALFLNHLKPLLMQFYENIISEIESSRNANTSNILEQMAMRIKHLGSALIMVNHTIKQMVGNETVFNENHLEEAAMIYADVLLDLIVFTSAKKMQLALEKNVLR